MTPAKDTRGTAARGMIAWALLGVVCCLALLAVVLRAPLLSSLGLTRDGAPATIDPTLLEPPASPSQHPAGNGLLGAVEPLPAGIAPTRATLEARLNALDVSSLKTADGTQVLPAYSVIDLGTGEVLAARGETSALIPASNTKLLTSVALMHHFAGDETFATTVVQPAQGQLVLVGGGDPMLASQPSAEGAYPQRASTQELAERTAEALRESGQTSVTLGYDASLFTDPGWAPTWPQRYVDVVSKISALWVDEGMANTTRVPDPAAHAAATFKAQLQAAGITVNGEPAPTVASGEEVARVASPPVHVLMETAMLESNNSYTEVLGFQLALATGHSATFAGSAAAVQAELTELGLWEPGASLSDTSGLSRENVVTPRMLTGAVRLVAAEPRLGVIFDGLPIAGVTGTLADRFFDAAAVPARGVARGKTGTLNFVSSLAGTTITADGAQVAFAFVLNGQVNGWAAEMWSDQAAGVLTSCGC